MKAISFLFLLVILSHTANAFELEIKGFELNGKVVETQSEASALIEQLHLLENDEEYEVEIDLCVVYGAINSKPVGRLEEILNIAGFQMYLEGIYGDSGNHLFEIYSNKTGNYLGALSGIYVCE